MTTGQQRPCTQERAGTEVVEGAGEVSGFRRGGTCTTEASASASRVGLACTARSSAGPGNPFLMPANAASSACSRCSSPSGSSAGAPQSTPHRLPVPRSWQPDIHYTGIHVISGASLVCDFWCRTCTSWCLVTWPSGCLACDSWCLALCQQPHATVHVLPGVSHALHQQLHASIYVRYILPCLICAAPSSYWRTGASAKCMQTHRIN